MPRTGKSVVIAVPVEAASYADSGSGRPVIHREDAQFVERITRLRSFGLDVDVDVEYVGPDDFLDMNRDGLIVTCGPRQSPWLEQVLTADPRPDGQGGWLYAVGSRGTLWSCLVRCEYRSPDKQLVHSELLAPVKRRGRLKQHRSNR